MLRPRVLNLSVFLLILISFFSAPSLAFCCDNLALEPWAWQKCWSLLRFGLWIGSCAFAWWVSMDFYFPMLLDYTPSRNSWLSNIMGLVLSFFVISLLSSMVFAYFGFTIGWKNVTHLSADGRPMIYTFWYEYVEWSSILGVLWFATIAFFLPAIFISKDSESVWPKAAFAWSLGIFVFLVLASFIIFFGALSDEVRHQNNQIFPRSMVWLNIHWKWLSLLFFSLFLSFIFYLGFRGKREASF